MAGNRQCILITDNENKIMTEICYPRVKSAMEGYEFTGTDRKLLFEKKLALSDLKEMEQILAEYEKRRQVNKQNGFDEPQANSKTVRCGFGALEHKGIQRRTWRQFEIIEHPLCLLNQVTKTRNCSRANLLKCYV